MAAAKNARGRKARSGTKKISGVDFTWDPDLDDDKPAPAPLFPDYKANPPQPLSAHEKTQVSRFRSLLTNIHEGPLYTVLGDKVRVGKPSTSTKASFDSFGGMPTYSQKYTKRRRRIPKLDTRPYVLKFFPKELWATLDPSTTTATTIRNGSLTETAVGGKTLQLSKTKRADRLDGLGAEGSGDEEGEMGEMDEGVEEEEDVEEEEIVDDEYEEDEDEGGDYNAEQYFDDGGDDAGDDYDGGDGEGGDFY